MAPVAVMYLGSLCDLADTATLYQRPRYPFLYADPFVGDPEPGRPIQSSIIIRRRSNAYSSATRVCFSHPLRLRPAALPRRDTAALTLPDKTLVACHGVEKGWVEGSV
ncbi:MAG: hypothetical protein PVG41_18755 [Desulfobacteraceae bacterium]